MFVQDDQGIASQPLGFSRFHDACMNVFLTQFTCWCFPLVFTDLGRYVNDFTYITDFGQRAMMLIMAIRQRTDITFLSNLETLQVACEFIDPISLSLRT